MLGVSRRLVATVGAAATILMLTTSVVAAADPDSLASARGNGSPTAATVTLGVRAHDAGPVRMRLDHGGGLKPPATDVELAPIAVGAPVSGIGVALTTWVLVFAAGVVASLRYLARRSRL
jgi:hypothetical protein